MKIEMIVNVAANETRIAILEDDRLVELLVERPEKERMVGDIYKGLVTAVLPGIQAAFVDIGEGKNAFLHASDVANSTMVYGEPFDEVFSDTKRDRSDLSIKDMLKVDQEILAQVTKEPIGDKGPRVTTQISLPGRFLVLVPGEKHIGVSRKINNWEEKRRLKRMISHLRPEGVGIIVRTMGEGLEEKKFKSDLKSLLKTWKKIVKKAEKGRTPSLIHKEEGVTSSVIRDLFSSDVGRVVVDSKKNYRQIQAYLRSVSPQLRSRVELYQGKEPIFDTFGVEKEIEKMLNRKVWLKKRGYIVIEPTEALVTIDVNTGSYVGKGDQEETALKTNMEAAREIARQLRLRDIGGLIVIDFIDMVRSQNRQKVIKELRTALRRDRANSNLTSISEFGLVEMTRKRVRPSLFHTFSEPCPMCGGIGRVLSRETVVTKIERWLKRARASFGERKLRLRVHPTVADYLLENRRAHLKQLERQSRYRIEVESDTSINLGDYQFFSQESGEDLTSKFSL